MKLKVFNCKSFAPSLGPWAKNNFIEEENKRNVFLKIDIIEGII